MRVGEMYPLALPAYEMNLLAAALAGRWQALEILDEAALPKVCEDGTYGAELALRSRVGALLFDLCRHHCASPQAAALAPLRDAYTYTVVQNRVLLRELAQAVAALHETQVPVIVTKGAALAGPLYGDLGVRPMSDVDILIRHLHRIEALQLFRELGYTGILPGAHAQTPTAFENEFGVVNQAPPYNVIELHWHLFDSPHHQHHIDLDWFWATARPVDIEGVPALVLGPEAQMLHLCGHLALHHPVPSGGDLMPVLRWLVDIGEVIHHYGDELDWDVVLAKAQGYDLVLPLQTVLGYVRDLWPFMVPDDLWARIAALQPTRAERRVYKWLTAEHRPVLYRFATDLAMMPTWSMRAHYAAQNIFPSAEYMRWRYDIQRTWLLPAYYPYRWWVGLAGYLRRPQ